MPGFPFPKQRLDPDLALAQRLLVGLCAVIAPYAFQIRFVKAPVHLPPPITRRAFSFQWTAVTGCRSRLVDDHALGIFRLPAWEECSLRTAVLILVRVIGEALLPIERSPLVEVWEGHIGVEPRRLDRHNVLERAIAGVSRHLCKRHL